MLLMRDTIAQMGSERRARFNSALHIIKPPIRMAERHNNAALTRRTNEMFSTRQFRRNRHEQDWLLQLRLQTVDERNIRRNHRF